MVRHAGQYAALAREIWDRAELAAARDEFMQRCGEGFEYEALLGDREPPLDYRR